MIRLAWLIILVAACHPAAYKRTGSGLAVHPQQQAQSQPPIAPGFYQGITKASARLNIVPINDSMSYFELDENDDPKPPFCEGVFESATGTVSLFSDPLVKVKFSRLERDTVSIAFPDLSDAHYFNTQMAGTYHLVNPGIPKLNEPVYPKWDELDCLKDDSLILYRFPDTSMAPIHLLAAKKGDVVTITRSLSASQISPTEVFDFVRYQGKAGWTKARKLEGFLRQQFRCEWVDDHTISKDNRRERYVLYTDEKGNILKKETY